MITPDYLSSIISKRKHKNKINGNRYCKMNEKDNGRKHTKDVIVDLTNYQCKVVMLVEPEISRYQKLQVSRLADALYL